jgi:hypothetical protein
MASKVVGYAPEYLQVLAPIHRAIEAIYPDPLDEKDSIRSYAAVCLQRQAQWVDPTDPAEIKRMVELIIEQDRAAGRA